MSSSTPLDGFDKAIKRQFQDLTNQLRRRKIRGPDQCARETLLLLKRILGTVKWSNTKHMMDSVKAVGAALVDARPMELTIGNIVRRVLLIIRENFAAAVSAEAQAGNGGGDEGGGGGLALGLTAMRVGVGQAVSLAPSLEGVLREGAPVDFTAPVKNLMSSIMARVQDLEEELETGQDDISDQAEDHIPDGAKILTFGRSRSVEMFFLAAAKKQRQFQVLVCEAAPHYGGTKMAKRLAAAGLDVTLITDAAAFAVMALVDKVFLPTHAVMANGGLIAPSGSALVALAAREHAVPVVCITGLFKLCPLYPHDLDAFNELGSPAGVLEYEDSDRVMLTSATTTAEVLNPEYDFVPPETIDLFVTNTGGHQPSYVYRLLNECYHPDDRAL